MKNLITQTISGFITLLAILGVCTMLPAWTIYYPQAWIYLLVFAVTVILITIYLFKNDPKLLERRVKAGPAAEREKRQKIIQSLASLFFVLIYVVSGFDYRFHWSSIPMNISLFADVFVALGFYVVFLVFRENSYTSAVIEVNEDQKVI
jgi:protein-S-isoprenylcysteine O-methyltransferase Ste14